MDLLSIARSAIKNARKGTSTKDAAEIVRRAIQAKSSGQWFVRERPDHPGVFYVSAVNGGMSGGFEVFTSKHESNGLTVTYSQWH